MTRLVLRLVKFRKLQGQIHQFLELRQIIITANLHSAVFGPEMPVEFQTRRSDFDQLVRSVNEASFQAALDCPWPRIISAKAM